MANSKRSWIQIFLEPFIEDFVPSGGTTPSLPPSTTPNTGSGNDAPVYVENYLDISVCYLNISPTSSEDWGDDWLGNEMIYPNETKIFWVPISYSPIDMQVFDCETNLLDQQSGIVLTSEGITYTLSPNP